jgi:hypothetical protein
VRLLRPPEAGSEASRDRLRRGHIEQDRAAEEFVLSVNNGMATVPTLRLPNGEVMTNPPLPALLAAVA